MEEIEKFGTPVRTIFRQRKWDGKWERLGLFQDKANAYSYYEWGGSTKVTLIPEKWITIGVYDLFGELVD